MKFMYLFPVDRVFSPGGRPRRARPSTLIGVLAAIIALGAAVATNW